VAAHDTRQGTAGVENAASASKLKQMGFVTLFAALFIDSRSRKAGQHPRQPVHRNYPSSSKHHHRPMALSESRRAQPKDMQLHIDRSCQDPWSIVGQVLKPQGLD
jgi:hypothetical protein